MKAVPVLKTAAGTTPGDAIFALVYVNDTPGAQCTHRLSGSHRGAASLVQMPSASLGARGMEPWHGSRPRDTHIFMAVATYYLPYCSPKASYQFSLLVQTANVSFSTETHQL